MLSCACCLERNRADRLGGMVFEHFCAAVGAGSSVTGNDVGVR
jgi:hypothetical protein